MRLNTFPPSLNVPKDILVVLPITLPVLKSPLTVYYSNVSIGTPSSVPRDI